jgi:hypothetical protein
MKKLDELSVDLSAPTTSGAGIAASTLSAKVDEAVF